jgi:hypothetical protein
MKNIGSVMKEVAKHLSGFPITYVSMKAFPYNLDSDQADYGHPTHLEVIITLNLTAFQEAYTVQSADKTLQLIITTNPICNTKHTAFLVTAQNLERVMPLSWQDFTWNTATGEPVEKTLEAFIDAFFGASDIGEFVLRGS